MVGPGVLEMVDNDESLEAEMGEEDGLWFDYAFVEFLKTNYISVQRAILLEPNAADPSRRSVDGGEYSEVTQALRSTIASQTRELEEARSLLLALESERDEDRQAFRHEISVLTEQVVSLRQNSSSTTEVKASDLADLQKHIYLLEQEVKDAQQQKHDADKEQEDLFVLLEELSAKRKVDKGRMRDAGLEVSEDEDEDDGQDEDL
jgi:hypothetical protein